MCFLSLISNYSDIVSSSDYLQSQDSNDAKTDDLKQDDLNYFNEMKYPFDSTLHDWLNIAIKQITSISELKEQIKSLGE